MKLDSLSLFFPCYNEEANVGFVIQEALRVAAQTARKYEVIIVDDGSCDRTSHVVKRLAEKDTSIRMLQHVVNKGYGEALKSGFRAARFSWVFYSDCDGQFNLRELPKLVEKTVAADIISGYRIQRADSWYRRLNARIFAVALRFFMRLRIPDVDCAFKLYRREIFDHININSSGAMIDAEILAKAQRFGYRIETVGVSHRPRIAGAQTGSKPRVILKAMKEFWVLWWDLVMMRGNKPWMTISDHDGGML